MRADMEAKPTRKPKMAAEAKVAAEARLARSRRHQQGEVVIK